MPRTVEEQTNSLAMYLPPGRAFASKNVEGTVTRALLQGLSGELVRNEALMAEFRDQIIPDKTVLFVDEWERALGIPDDCFQGTGSLDERRSDVLAKLASLGVQTNEDFRRLALQAYGVELTLVNPTRSTDNVFPYTFNPTGEPDPNNDGGSFIFNLSDREARFQLVIVYNNLPTAVTFPYTFPLPFGTREQAIIECLFVKLRPANVGFTKQVPIPQTSPVPQPIPPSPPPISEASLKFVQSNLTRLATSTPLAFARDFNIPNDSTKQFSIMVWDRRDLQDGNQKTVFQFGRSASFNENTFNLFHGAGGELISWQIFADATSGQKLYEYSAALPPVGQWAMHTCTFDGTGGATAFEIYQDGTLDATPLKSVDNDISGITQINMPGSLGTSSQGLVGYTGALYSVAIWDKELTAAEVTSIYNGGDASAVDLLEDFDNYVSSANLVSWWLPGRAPADGGLGNGLGKDYGPNGNPINTEINLTDADKDADIPQAP